MNNCWEFLKTILYFCGSQAPRQTVQFLRRFAEQRDGSKTVKRFQISSLSETFLIVCYRILHPATRGRSKHLAKLSWHRMTMEIEIGKRKNRWILWCSPGLNESHCVTILVKIPLCLCVRRCWWCLTNHYRRQWLYYIQIYAEYRFPVTS